MTTFQTTQNEVPEKIVSLYSTAVKTNLIYRPVMTCIFFSSGSTTSRGPRPPHFLTGAAQII